MVRGFVVLVALLIPGIAFAEHTAEHTQTQTAMEDYFAGEQRGGYLLMGMGAAGLVAGGLLLRSNSQVGKGASYPLLTVGVLHIAAGIFVSVSSSRRVDTFTEQIAKDPQAFVATERKRMEGVSTQFSVLKVVEVVLIAGGLTMAGIGHRTDRPRLKGAGLAIAVEMAMTLGFDVIAANRAHGYRDELAAIDVQAGLDPVSGAPTAMLVHTGTF